jgi:beta-lactamase superfamily II metal-dependent hydrolase
MKRLLPYENLKLLKFIRIFFLCGILIIALSCTNSYNHPDLLDIKSYPNRQQDFSIWQLDQFFDGVQMGYILKTDDNRIVIIDGGGIKTAPILENYLKQLGGVVDMWIITHPHLDHMGSLLEIIGKNSIDIQSILQIALDDSWVLKNEPDSYENFKRYSNTLKKSNISLLNAVESDVLELGEGVEMTILSSRNDAIVNNAINNSSLVFKVSSKSKSVLFLGDLGPEGGDKIIDRGNLERLKADYVQMAHHGQKGVNKNFYEAVQANYALWPTPEWLWENRALGKGVDSGEYKTLQVRKWMTDLNIKRNYVAGIEKTVQID